MFTITSFLFFCFLAVSLMLYWLIPTTYRWLALLTISIYFFVNASRVSMIPYLLYGIILTYFGALLIQKAEKPETKKKILIVTLILAILQLVCLKYLNMFVGIDQFFVKNAGIGFGWEPVKLLAPIGISYYMISAIGYILDVYWGSVKAETNILKHSLFLCYFPQMTSGPFTKYVYMRKELFSQKKFDCNQLVYGFERTLWGLYKKLVIADRLSTIVATIYGDLSTYQGCYILVGIFCYAIQLYCDFSGCMDIILGISEMFGIRLPENFDLPFFSEDVSEFWRRWHISLGVWFKEYLFYPILKSDFMQKIGKKAKKRFGKKAGKDIPTYIGLVCNWIIIGIWHGGSLKYMVASAVIPCFYLIMSNVLQPVFKKIVEIFHINTDCTSYRWIKRIRTFLLMCIVFGVARSDDMNQAGILFANIFNEFNPWIFFDGSLFQLGLDAKEIWMVCAAIIFLFMIEALKYRIGSLRMALQKQNIVFRWSVIYLLIFGVITFGVYGPNYNAVDFIYGAF